MFPSDFHLWILREQKSGKIWEIKYVFLHLALILFRTVEPSGLTVLLLLLLFIFSLLIEVFSPTQNQPSPRGFMVIEHAHCHQVPPCSVQAHCLLVSPSALVVVVVVVGLTPFCCLRGCEGMKGWCLCTWWSSSSPRRRRAAGDGWSSLPEAWWLQGPGRRLPVPEENPEGLWGRDGHHVSRCAPIG